MGSRSWTMGEGEGGWWWRTRTLGGPCLKHTRAAAAYTAGVHTCLVLLDGRGLVAACAGISRSSAAACAVPACCLACAACATTPAPFLATACSASDDEADWQLVGEEEAGAGRYQRMVYNNPAADEAWNEEDIQV